MLDLAVMDMVGEATTLVWVFNPFAEPIAMIGDVLMVSMNNMLVTRVTRVLINGENPLGRLYYQ